MKKNILKVAFVAIVGLILCINMLNAQKTVTLSDIALANVEALSFDEIKPKYSVFPCPDRYGTECNTAQKDRPECYTKTNC